MRLVIIAYIGAWFSSFAPPIFFLLRHQCSGGNVRWLPENLCGRASLYWSCISFAMKPSENNYQMLHYICGKLPPSARLLRQCIRSVRCPAFGGPRRGLHGTASNSLLNHLIIRWYHPPTFQWRVNILSHIPFIKYNKLERYSLHCIECTAGKLSLFASHSQHVESFDFYQEPCISSMYFFV